MKKATKLKLFAFLLFAGPIIFTQCKEKAENALKPGMPYYQVENKKQPVDSVSFRDTNDGIVEVVYFSDGRVVSYYSLLNIKNLTLRELYLNHLKENGYILSRMSLYKDLGEIDYVSFNTYLVTKGLPPLTLKEFYTYIKGKSLRGPPANNTYMLKIAGIFVIVIVLGAIYILFVNQISKLLRILKSDTYDDS